MNFLIGKGCQKKETTCLLETILLNKEIHFAIEWLNLRAKVNIKGLGWSKSLQKWKVNISVDNKK